MMNEKYEMRNERQAAPTSGMDPEMTNRTQAAVPVLFSFLVSHFSFHPSPTTP
jgi:hypothetical protein